MYVKNHAAVVGGRNCLLNDKISMKWITEALITWYILTADNAKPGLLFITEIGAGKIHKIELTASSNFEVSG